MHNRGYVGQPDPTDPTILHLRRIDADGAPETVVPAIHAIRQRTFASDTTATAAALLTHHWTRLDATTTEHTHATGDIPVAGVGTTHGEDDAEPPTTLPATRLGELPARWVYLIDPSTDALAVLSTDGPAHLLATGWFPRVTADPATTGQPSPDAADTTAVPASAATAPLCTCGQQAEAAQARLAGIEARAAHVRRHVRDGVAAGTFDLDVTNDLLERLGLEPLPRYWTVNLLVTVSVTVPATGSDDAVNTARDRVGNVLAGADIVDGYDVNDVDAAIPGGLASEPPASQTRRRASRPVMS